ncbi:unnamed protein product [Penicillium olsonii]|uniref:PHD and RING finger domain protein n=1 Tax=Penicillium olsonii TaxID=99116 RepID=A0A9W4HMX9_PENOL|nr:unnamed protein product [Penicillium olsonii]CAG7932396.1 unnamed protein product [Penicillium olsonii]CAG7953855.1 unnamed protein product [Penicillium olsonii]CAG8067455.1 unnamed protein product [Penicillium olsonii]
MSDTCIVCLGDLGEGTGDPLEPLGDLNLKDEDSQIAQLLPCGHILHNNCLKPWVERANSCPICRQSFNMVELSDRPGGAVVSSYAVQDRTQTADIDPSMIIEYVEDDLADYQPCTICGQADNEDVLLLCDGCDIPSHLYCIGLDEIPPGAWYCQQCESQRALGPAPEAPPARPPRSEQRTQRSQRSQRTRAQQRRLQNRNQTNSLHWARVWQSVWDNLNLDLDFPFDDDRSAERVIQQRRREEANQREFQAWQRRFEVAERQGGGNRFRDAAPLFDVEAARPSRPRVPRVPSPEPESLEEMRAWNAFERAREIENNPNAARKRKEPTMSPSPEPTEPQRKLKRPRTRRPQELAALAQQNQNGESSRAGAASSSARPNGENPAGPSFLSSLLKEVEDAPSRTNSYGPSASTSVAPTDHPSPGPSSPSISPTSSSYSSPLLSSATPPPFPRSRPISPLQLSSPAEPPSPPFSPELPFSVSPPRNQEFTRQSARPRSRIPQRLNTAISHPHSHSRSPDSSPTRAGPSLALKADIQKMVGTALKPHYKKKTISKEQYTNINRCISRMLYDRVGDRETLEPDERTNLDTEARHEVQNTIDALKRQSKEKQKQRAADDN